MAKKLKFNEKAKGFTLLEALIALTVISGICLLFSYLVSFSKTVYKDFPNNYQQEFHTFLFQLEQLAEPLQTVSIKNGQVYFSDPLPNYDAKTEFSLRYINGRIDKTKGVQPLLTGVKKFYLEREEGAVLITVIFEDDQKSQGVYLLKRYQAFN